MIGEGPIVGNPAEGYTDVSSFLVDLFLMLIHMKLIKAYFNTLDGLVAELITKFEEEQAKARPPGNLDLSLSF